jgi:hypothetical protein
MSVDEHQRHRLYNRVVEVLGPEEADILMAHLPPGGYPNLATKQDLLELERRLRLEIVGELKSFTLRTILLANLGMAAAFAGIAFTAAGIR